MRRDDRKTKIMNRKRLPRALENTREPKYMQAIGDMSFDNSREQKVWLSKNDGLKGYFEWFRVLGGTPLNSHAYVVPHPLSTVSCSLQTGNGFEKMGASISCIWTDQPQ